MQELERCPPADRRDARVCGALVLGLLGLAAPLAGQRPVVVGAIISDALPAATIHVDPSLAYVGGTAFDLYGIANAEIHLFVESDGDRVKRLLWVQFEGYRADNDHTYDYSGDPTVDIGGRDFHVNARFYPPSGFGGRPGSDGDRAARLLEENGLRLGSDLARVRLVWLLDEPPRNELMLIYLEDLADHGLSLDDLRADEERWRSFADGLRERGGDAIRIEGR